jgi:hypothetical protein
LKARGEGSWPVTAGGARDAARLTRPEVGDGPDGRVPPVSGRNGKKKGGRRVWAGEVADWANVGQFARAGKRKKKKGQPAWDLAGWARKGERERGREEFVSFFSNFFQIHFSNIQTPNK